MDLTEFLSRLSQDPRTLAEALRDPKQAVEEARLDERGRQALQSRTAQALWDVLLKREAQPIPPAAPLPAEIQEGLEGRRGSLVVVGTGIRTVGHMTVEALAWIRIADAMFTDSKAHAFCMATDATGAPVRAASQCQSWDVFVFLADHDHIVFRYVQGHATSSKIADLISTMIHNGTVASA